MKIKAFSLALCSLFMISSIQGQIKTIKFNNQQSVNAPKKISIDLRTSGPISSLNTDYLGFQFEGNQLSKHFPKVLNRGDNGQPIAISYKPKSTINQRSQQTNEKLAFNYIKDLSTVLNLNTITDQFKLNSTTMDEYGVRHTKLTQTFKGIPVFGHEIMIHGDEQGYNFFNGRCQHVDEMILITPSIVAKQVNLVIKKQLRNVISFDKIPASLQKWIKIPHSSPELVIYINDDSQKLAWHQIIHANAIKTYEVLLDAQTGTVLDYWTTTCKLHYSVHDKHAPRPKEKVKFAKTDKEHISYNEGPEGDETASGRDLNGRNQQFNVWKDNGRFFMIDASQNMYQSNNSKMPNEPVGALWTLDGFNTSPAKNSFKVDHIQSSNSSWSALSVSAHSNALKAFKYFQETHKRNSINGKGGNVVSFIRISDENGRNMDNAFWNGQAIFYGNGNTQFKQLAGGLDVAGHEMTHGVIQNTANLIYKNEPGAINESMADVFGVMIDRNDWLLGEDIIIKSSFPSGAMRSMKNPNNGGRGLNDPGYQPAHVNEQFRGEQDNGGVHINSGIPNHAFYLFVQKMARNNNESQAKGKAEKVYYNALSNFLGRSSKFIDLRIAIIKAAQNIYGANSSEVKAAQDAFSEVGIGQSLGGDYQNDLKVNPGNRFFLATDINHDRLELFNVSQGGNGVLLSNSGLINRPSVTDDGSVILFVAKDNKIHALIRNNNGGYDESIIQKEAIWRNACIAKDGSRIAALTSSESPTIDVFDFGKSEWNTFDLYNPTYTQGVSTGDVNYADAMEFEPSGQFLTYDGFSTIRSNTGSDYEYWDIGFIEIWNNNARNWAKGDINKLFSGLPQNISIGNPTFSKNSPYIIAFDLLEDDVNGQSYQLWGANIESGKTNKLFDNSELAYPNYNVVDKVISFNAIDQQNNSLIAQLPLQSDKINSGGTASPLLNGGQWGIWFADGNRDLDVATYDIDNNNDKFSILNNPVRDQLIIILAEDLSSKSPIFEIIDQNGKVLTSVRIGQVTHKRQVEISTIKLMPGIYTLLMHDSNLTSHRKFIKL